MAHSVLALIFPMGSHALFVDVVHSLRANLNFNPFTIVAHQGYVKRLVAVGLRMAHPVAESVGMGFVDLGQSYVDVEAIVDFFFRMMRRKDNADGKDVEDFIKRNVLVLYLRPNRVGAFDA